MYVTLSVLILIGSCVCCWSACTYPSDLIGEWYSTSFGTLNFVTNQSFSGFTSDLSAAPLTFTCHEASGSQYVSTSSYILVASITVDVYLCMNLRQISSVKYYYTLDGNRDSGTGVRFYSPTNAGDVVTLATACTRTDTRSPGEYELLIKKDQLLSAVTSCPSDLQSTFNVTMTTSSSTSCTGSTMEGSTGALVFNYSSCVTGQFNSGGYLQCLYSKTDGYSYATLYNNDSTTDESSTYKFTCLAYEKNAETLQGTESPNSCLPSQTPTSIDSPGITYVMTDLLYTPKEQDFTTIIIVVCCIAVVIIIVIIVVIVYFKVCRKPKPEPPPKIRKRKRKLSITDYTPRSLGRASSVEKIDDGAINKKSAEEIITGITEDKKDKHVLLNGDAYEPPKKQAWQKKWENVRNKISPRLTQENLRRMKETFASDGGISSLGTLSISDLDKAYTLSTSLPESIDIPFKQSTKSVNVDATLRNSGTPKYTEKSHATPNIPASTGKFGGTPKIRSTESIQMPAAEPKLDTITENPLSRENTCISQKGIHTKRLREHPNLTRILSGGDVTSLSTVLTSHSTASGWQYKWETKMRPKNILSEIKRYIQRSQTPVKLFQNVIVAEPSCTASVNKRTDDKDYRKTEQKELTESESDNHITTEGIKETKENCESNNHHNGQPNDTRNDALDEVASTTSDTSRKTIVTFLDETDCETNKSSPETFKKKSKKSIIKKKTSTLYIKKESKSVNAGDSYKKSIDSLENVLNDTRDGYNDALNIDKERRDSVASSIYDTTSIGEPEDIIETKSVSAKSGSMRTLEQIEYDTVSLHSELFFPDDWLYNSNSALDQIWKIGKRSTSSKRKKEYKQYIGYDEDLVLKKEISPFKKMKIE